MQRTYRFRDGKKLILGGRTLVMGILNVTPDSFSDGGKWNTRDRALRHMEEMVHDGADIIDIGAESSRPGFVPMGATEETERLMPFLESVLAECPVPVSVDTFKAETARAALSAGAHSAERYLGASVCGGAGGDGAGCGEANVPVIVMHNQNGTAYSEDIIASMREFFARSLVLADEAGLARENIILDPGIGFGKTAEQNLQVIKRMDELVSYEGADYPVLLGASRKSFIGAALGLPVEERMEATGAACVLGIARGACIMRVHDVKPIVRMCRMADAILGA